MPGFGERGVDFRLQLIVQNDPHHPSSTGFESLTFCLVHAIDRGVMANLTGLYESRPELLARRAITRRGLDRCARLIVDLWFHLKDLFASLGEDCDVKGFGAWPGPNRAHLDQPLRAQISQITAQ